MRIGRIGPVPVQAHFRSVCDCLLIDSAAGAVGKTSGSSSVLVAIIISVEICALAGLPMSAR